MRGVEWRFIVLAIIAIAVLALSLLVVLGGKGPLEVIIAQNALRSCCETMRLTEDYSGGQKCDGEYAWQLADKAKIPHGKIKEFCSGG